MLLSRYDLRVRAARPAHTPASPPTAPVAAWTVDETLPDRSVGRVGTVIVQNGECPYSCVMCGYWKDLGSGPPEPGAVSAQISRTLDNLDQAGRLQAVKLYNGSSLFDPESLPLEDLAAIADRSSRYAWVTVESRADLVLERPAVVREFAGLLSKQGVGRLEVAIGLEAADDRLRAALNRREPLKCFDRAVERLHAWGVAVKAFVLVKPPFVSEAAGLELARRTVDYACERGVESVALLPTVPTPGLSEQLVKDGYFRPCDLRTLAAAVEYALAGNRCRVLVETCELAQLPACNRCRGVVSGVLAAVNLGRAYVPAACDCAPRWSALLDSDRVRGWDEYRSSFLKSSRVQT